jgi:pimeloyl-ACP methyl ester carboxylesterase
MLGLSKKTVRNARRAVVSDREQIQCARRPPSKFHNADYVVSCGEHDRERCRAGRRNGACSAMRVSETSAQASDELTASVAPFLSSPIHVRNIAFTLVSIATVILLLQLMQPVLIPFVVAALLFYALDPPVDWLQKRRVPRVAGAALMLLIVVSGNRGIGESSRAPATSIEPMATDAITFIKAIGFERVDLFGFSMGGMIAQEIVLMEPQLVRKMIIAGTGPAVGEGISKVARVTYLDIVRGLLTHQDPKQFLFFTRTPGGIRAGKEFLARLKERSQNRDKEATVTVLQAQLKALRRWGSKAPADLSKIHQPVLVANGESDRMVPSKNTHDLARRLPNSDLIIYPDSGHRAVFQFHANFVPRALEFLAR